MSCPEDETNEALTTTVVDKISQAEIDISVCHRQRKKVAGKQLVLVKFLLRNKRNEILNKKKKLRFVRFIEVYKEGTKCSRGLDAINCKNAKTDGGIRCHWLRTSDKR